MGRTVKNSRFLYYNLLLCLLYIRTRNNSFLALSVPELKCGQTDESTSQSYESSSFLLNLYHIYNRI